MSVDVEEVTTINKKDPSATIHNGTTEGKLTLSHRSPRDSGADPGGEVLLGPSQARRLRGLLTRSGGKKGATCKAPNLLQTEFKL